MTLIHLETGTMVRFELGHPIYGSLTFRKGVKPKGQAHVKEIIEPCEQWPEGLIKVGREEDAGWSEYLPSVFNVRIVS